MSFFKSLFGGTDDSAQKYTMRQNAASQDYIKQQTGQAQNYLSGVLPQMQNAMYQGFQGAADMYGQAAPQQLQALQQGNMAAQRYLLGGLPAFQAAIMGDQFDMGQFAQSMQPTQINYDPSMFQRQVFNPLAGSPQ